MPRRKVYNDEYHKTANKLAKEYYRKHREKRLTRMREYHKKNKEIMQLGAKLGVSIPEAREILRDNPDLVELFKPNPKKEEAERKLEQIKKELMKK